MCTSRYLKGCLPRDLVALSVYWSDPELIGLMINVYEKLCERSREVRRGSKVQNLLYPRSNSLDDELVERTENGLGRQSDSVRYSDFVIVNFVENIKSYLFSVSFLVCCKNEAVVFEYVVRVVFKNDIARFPFFC